MTGTLARLARNSRRAVSEGVYDTKYNMPKGPGLAQAVREGGIISEIKFASPSQGTILESEDAIGMAGAMVRGGACGISVLTQPYLFGGRPEYLARVREHFPQIPILMKDIVIDYAQVDAASDIGADCILLIQAVFDAGLANDMDGFVDRAHERDLQVLLEVHDRMELESALATGCDMIGVNNRNLDTLEISLDTTRIILEGYSDCRPVISESGIESPDDIRYLAGCGAGAFLVGTSIMKSGNVEGSVRALAGAV